MNAFRIIISLTAIAILCSCTKEVIVVVPDNPVDIDYQYIPTEKIEFYLNRVFIDLIGREPLNEEMAFELDKIKKDTLSIESRLELVLKLQTDTSYIEGDSSYLHAYSTNLYNLSKIKLLEGVADADFDLIIGILKGQRDRDSITGNIEGFEIKTLEIQRHEKVLNSNIDFRKGLITYDRLLGRMIDNNVYDIINMNTFNFVNASFDNLLWRYPTSHEFSIAFDMCANDISGTLFHQTGANKLDYIDLLVESNEMAQGITIEVFQQLLARRPTVIEMADILKIIIENRDIRLIQQKIMITDEYANF